MNILETIDNITIKRTAIETLLKDEANRELIADRIIILLNGDTDTLDLLFTGIPMDFASVAERLKAEDWFKEKYDDIISVTSFEFMSATEIQVFYIHRSVRYIMPGDKEAKETILAGKYAENSRYYSDSTFSEAVQFEESTQRDIRIQDLGKAGIRFSRL